MKQTYELFTHSEKIWAIAENFKLLWTDVTNGKDMRKSILKEALQKENEPLLMKRYAYIQGLVKVIVLDVGLMSIRCPLKQKTAFKEKDRKMSK